MLAQIDDQPGVGQSSERELDARFTFANERTFLAWNRTAIALVGGGLALAQLLDFDVQGVRLVAALPVIGLGALLGVVSYRRWRACEAAMRQGQPLPANDLPRMLSIGVVVVALSAAAAAVLELLAS